MISCASSFAGGSVGGSSSTLSTFTSSALSGSKGLLLNVLYAKVAMKYITTQSKTASACNWEQYLSVHENVVDAGCSIDTESQNNMYL